MHHILDIDKKTYEHDFPKSSAKDGRQTLVETPPNFDTCVVGLSILELA